MVGLCIYRLFFHPLARYPGPWLAKVSNLYAAYHAWLGDVHIDMWRCHQKYGDALRYAPDRLLVNTAEARRLFGPPSVPLGKLVDWTADWVARGMPTLGKDTHYDVRDGVF